MTTEGDSARRDSHLGLLLGPVGFAATLAAPGLGALPGSDRHAGAVGFALMGAAALLLTRWARPARTPGVLLLTVGLGFLLAPGIAAMPGPARLTLAVTVLMASWWISVAIPIAATSLLPLVLFPVLGILPSGKTAGVYANNNIFLFMGGFIIALGIQRWGLHRRMALVIVKVVGTSPRRMVLGFMVAAAFLSMWISNTATTLMMLPIALAVISSLKEVDGLDVRVGFAPALLLGVAHASSIGGLATPIGTPPNISFLRIQKILYPDAPGISFGEWSLAFLPLVVIFLPVAWWIITAIHRTGSGGVKSGREVVAGWLRRLGPLRGAERRVLIVFAITALLWITRRDLVVGSVTVSGWSGLVERWVGPPFVSGNLHDATVAISMAVVLFLIPGDPDPDGTRTRLMDWATAKKLPWGILLLFGGGFALAQAFKDSGLSEYLGRSFAAAAGEMPRVAIVAGTSGVLSFLTEVTSNTATTEVMLPVLAGTAEAMRENPLLLMLPATLSASCAFMLPIATPPNAIVFGSGQVDMKDMVRTGIPLNLVGIVLVTAVFLLWSSGVLGIDFAMLPSWATP